MIENVLSLQRQTIDKPSETVSQENLNRQGGNNHHV